MPTSWYQAVPAIIDLVMSDQPSSILDIGVGFGKYGVLLRESFDIPHERYEKKDWHLQLDGVEGFEGYRNPIHDYIYNTMYYGNIYTVLPQLKQTYDTILLIDVLEHFDKREGLKLLERLLEITNTSLIVSTPIMPAPQEEYLGNTLEQHKSRWSVVDFVDFDYHFSQVNVGHNGANIFKLYPKKQKKEQIVDIKTKRPLKIGYVLPHHSLTGGMKMLLEQMKRLRERGHHITAFFKGEQGSPVLPSWSEITVDEEVLVSPLELFAEQEKAQECDVLVVGWIYQLLEFKGKKKNVFYWEQGHESLFGDIPDYGFVPGVRNSLDLCYRAGIPIVSVSSFVAKVLKARYDLETAVITNGIDTNVFQPLLHREESSIPIVLLVGSPHLRFKGFSDALKALKVVWDSGVRFKVHWICQQKSDLKMDFPITYFVQPKQDELVSIYQRADLLLCASWYEGFGMPPLEAMACGTAVVATDSGGVQEYALNQYNCLLNDPGDIHGLANSVIKVLQDEALRERLCLNGRATARKFSYEHVLQQLEKYMEKMISSS